MYPLTAVILLVLLKASFVFSRPPSIPTNGHWKTSAVALHDYDLLTFPTNKKSSHLPAEEDSYAVSFSVEFKPGFFSGMEQLVTQVFVRRIEGENREKIFSWKNKQWSSRSDKDTEDYERSITTDAFRLERCPKDTNDCPRLEVQIEFSNCEYLIMSCPQEMEYRIKVNYVSKWWYVDWWWWKWAAWIGVVLILTCVQMIARNRNVQVDDLPDNDKQE